MTDTRKKALISLVMLASAVGVGAFITRLAGRPAGAPPGRCEVETTNAVTADVRDHPRSVLAHGGYTWVLLTAPEAPPPRVRVRVARIPPRGPGAVMYTGRAPSADAVTGLGATPAQRSWSC